MASDKPAAATPLQVATGRETSGTPMYVNEAADAYEAGRAEEREACARLAEQNNATYSPPCTKPNCAAAPHRVGQAPFADLIRARTAP